MAAFLMEGGLENEIKEQKAKVEEEKKQERIEAGVEATEEDEEIVYEKKRAEQVKGDMNMEGEMLIQKTELKTKNKGDLLSNVMSGVGNIAVFGGDMVLNQLKFLKHKPWFAIKKGVLYQYEKKAARNCKDSFKIAEIQAIAMVNKKPPADDDLTATIIPGENKNQAQFQMIYQKFYCIFTVNDTETAEKWVNSIKMVQEELKMEGTEYNSSDEEKSGNPQQAQSARYEKMQIYQKVTGKSAFKDYEVLMEAFEKKEMLLLFIRGQMYMED